MLEQQPRAAELINCWLDQSVDHAAVVLDPAAGLELPHVLRLDEDLEPQPRECSLCL